MFRSFGDVKQMFRKGVDATNNFFKKGGSAEQMLDKVSRGLGEVSTGLTRGSEYIDKVLESPLGQQLIRYKPELINTFRNIQRGAEYGSTLSGQASSITDRNAYGGDTNDRINDVIQRAKAIHHTTQNQPTFNDQYNFAH